MLLTILTILIILLLTHQPMEEHGISQLRMNMLIVQEILTAQQVDQLLSA